MSANPSMAMPQRSRGAESSKNAQPGSILLVVHEFNARSPDELNLAKGDRIELIEKDDDFGDGWYLGKHLHTGDKGLFPEVYTTCAPKGTLNTSTAQKLLGKSSTYTSVTKDRKTEDNVPLLSKSTSSLPLHENGTQTVAAANTSINDPYPMNINTQPTGISRTAPSSTKASPMTPSSAQFGLGQRSNSQVMNETLSVIDEHITDMRKPVVRAISPGRKPLAERHLSAASEYSTMIVDSPRLSYIQGSESEEEEAGRITEQEVKNWSPERVAEYLEDNGVDKKHCDVFKEQEFSGEVLLSMDQSSIFLKELDLGPIGRRLRTWQKIRTLQDDVNAAKQQETKRRVSEPPGGGSKRSRQSPQIENTRVTDPIDIATEAGVPTVERKSSQYGGASPLGMISASAAQSPRPSAASIRNLGHSRRHSSIDQALNQQSQPTSPYTRSGHGKQASFDRSWNMGTLTPSIASTTSLTNGATLRPRSSHMHSMSNDRAQFEKHPSQLSLNIPTSSVTSERERGYVSDVEKDSKRERRVLKKSNSQLDGTTDHRRVSSYESAKRKSVAFFRKSSSASARPNTTELTPAAVGAPIQETVVHTESGAAPASSNRVVSAPVPSKESSPMVTKLEYGDESPRAAIARESSIAGTRDSMVSSINESQNPPITSSNISNRGHRAVSDAITTHEKTIHNNSMATSVAASQENIAPSEISTPQSPGSTTPSATSKSMEIEEGHSSRFPMTGFLANTSGTKRRSKKKQTSAYQRGLEQKSPQEQIQDCEYHGWMKKKSSNLMTNWKPRLFVLRGRRLSYYYSEMDTEEKGLIDISNHRVLPANDEFLTGLHATVTRATSGSQPNSPATSQLANFSPHLTQSPTTVGGSIDGVAHSPLIPSGPSTSPVVPKDGGDKQGFIFKLVPPRTGLSKAVNFTKPTVHYFVVPTLAEGRMWMAALMKATIDRDESVDVITTYQQKTISLAKARARKERPPALRGSDDEASQAAGGTAEVDSQLESVAESADAEQDIDSKYSESADTKYSEPDDQMREVTNLEDGMVSPKSTLYSHHKMDSRDSKRSASGDNGLGIKLNGNGGPESQNSPQSAGETQRRSLW